MGFLEGIVFVGIRDKAQLNQDRRAFVFSKHIKATRLDPAIFCTVGTDDFPLDIGGESRGAGGGKVGLGPRGAGASGPIEMNAHEHGVPRAIRDRNAFVEWNKIIAGAGFNHPKPGGAEDSGDAQGNIQSEDFFVISFNSPGAGVVAAMPGVNYHRIEKTGAGAVRGERPARRQKKTSKEPEDRRGPRKQARSAQRPIAKARNPIPSKHHTDTLKIRQHPAQPISAGVGIFLSISGPCAAWMSACWPNESFPASM